MKSFLRAVALLLAVALGLLAPGCAAEGENSVPTPAVTLQPEATPALALPEQGIVAFSQMEYTRPDTQKILAQMECLAQQARACSGPEQACALAQQCQAYYDYFSTMLCLAMLHSSMDKNDSYWAAEETELSQQSAQISAAHSTFLHALGDTPYRQQVEAEQGKYYFADLDATEYVTEETEPLFQQEAALISEYSQKVNTLTIPYQGQQLTLDAVMAIEDYTSFMEAFHLWMDAYGEEIGGIYVELVALRQKIAHTLGFAQYVDLVFAMEQRDYTPQMVQEWIRNMQKQLLPAYRELEKVGANYYPQVSVNLEDALAFVGETLEALSPELSPSLAGMLQYDLCDLEPRVGKESGAYTTYLALYEAPFFLESYTGDAWSLSTLIHEFGHFNDYYTTHNKIPETVDTSEIFSQGLELLFSRYYLDAFGEDEGYQMMYDVLSDAFYTLISQPFYTAIELEVYQLPQEELNLENICAIARRQAERFGYGSENSDYYAKAWMRVSHLFEMPFYTFSYATSMDVALQLWEIALEDESQAVEAYLTLLKREQSWEFIQNVEAAGLKSPFAPGRMEHLAQLFQQYLVEEDWPLFRLAA